MNHDPLPFRLASLVFAAILFVAPWIGVGSVHLVAGHRLGIGVQPAFLLALVAMLCLAPRLLQVSARTDGTFLWWILALLWTTLSATQLWRVDDVGLLGEAPWSKGAKQVLLVAFLLGLAALPHALLAGSRQPMSTLRGWERAASAGLLVVSVMGVVQAVHFYVDVPGMAALERTVTSNPSIAAGSEELYLGHRFVGIPRVRGPACEPLYFGSYLLAVLPFTLAGLRGASARSRSWRLIAVGLGTLCLVLTFSRGVYLGAAALGLVVAGLMARGALPRPPRPAVVGAILGAVALAVGLAVLTGRAPWSIPELLWDRLAQSFLSHDMSNRTRWFSWRAALAMAVASPLWGVGWGGFGFAFFATAGAAASGAHFGWPVTNNVPLRVVAETGGLGLALWGVALWPSVRGIVQWRGQALSSPWDRAGLLMAVAVAAAGLQALTHSQLQLPHLWLLVGISSAFGSSRFRPV